ncbi:PrsW family intramembrane metalloprotease [Nocardioides sp. zg-536]|uniref:PrsW family intramembrane metalloprotease n=1 Tax=Nocardioides faecalis TaxID=2803858 RepID=A0A939BYW6_9ACTN|nr:PrsW family intramembrane metalloprotease [Nocardioides faecalis]MBM9460738.1 PrsW family intramembrane metalloprotease [Nocardioides faecalis]QVI57937.1 PrsW family intramembrane metalloprotease [Nocardioides faecalis]
MSVAPRSSIAFPVVVTVAVCLGAAATLLVLALSGAPGTTLLATALAALPVGPVLAAYLWLDRYEPEPRVLLASGLAWGAFVATMAAVFVQGLGGLLVGMTDTFSLAVVAPVVEEASKGLFLVLLLWWRRAEIDGILDGIVYAGMVGIGFAFTENILYLASAYNGTEGMGPGGVGAVTGTFVLRCVFSPFAHPLFTAFIGIGVGLAVGSRSGAVRVLAPVGGYLLAVLTHGLWNGSTVFGFGSFVLVYLVIMAPAFIGMVALAWWARETEAHLLRVALTDAARRGLLPATDIGWVVNLRGRRAARRYARQHGGPEAERAMRQYQQAAIELGFLHHRLLRGTAPADWQPRGQHFLGRIQAARPRIAFPGQVVPQQ